MRLPVSIKVSARSLLLIAVGILINANTGVAADRSGDFEMQLRELLSGTRGATKTIDKSPTDLADRHQKSHSDSPEQPGQFILGKPEFTGTVSHEVPLQSKTYLRLPASVRRDSSVHSDPQESVRRMILGTGSSS